METFVLVAPDPALVEDVFEPYFASLPYSKYHVVV